MNASRIRYCEGDRAPWFRSMAPIDACDGLRPDQPGGMGLSAERSPTTLAEDQVAGDVFGETAVFSDEPRATVDAVETLVERAVTGDTLLRPSARRCGPARAGRSRATGAE